MPAPRLACLATDYDGTLAEKGRLLPEIREGLARFRAEGGRLVLVTGRELAELRDVCPGLDVFDRVVAENGAVLYRPGDGSESILASPPPPAFIEAFQNEATTPVSVGRVVVASWRPDDALARRLIDAMGLPFRLILNKRAVMILPEGIDKATGLAAALAELDLQFDQVAGIGDAENDLDFLARCGRSGAVANALSAVKERVDVVTEASHGRGVLEFLERGLA